MEKVYVYIYNKAKSYEDIVEIAKKLYNKENLSIIKNENGKPFFNVEDVFVSISHTKDLFTFVLSPFNIGIDVEKYQEKKPLIVDKLFSIEEKKYYENSSSKQESFCEIWTKKEAYVKFDGRGICIIKKVDTFNETIKNNFQVLKIEDYIISLYSNKKFIYEINNI